VVLSGPLDSITSPLGFGVVNATRSGALNWRHVVTRRGNALAAAVDAAGDIVTAGFIRDRGEDHFIVAALSRANGSERWRAVLPGGDGAADAVAALDDGDVVAGGGAAGVDSLITFTVVRGFAPRSRNSSQLPFTRLGIQLYHALLTTILPQHRQLHHVGMIKFSDALFIGRCTKLRQGGA